MFRIQFICRGVSAAIFLFAIGGTTVSQAQDYQIVAPGDALLEATDGRIQARLSGDGCAAGFEAACTTTRQRSEYLSTVAHQHGDRIAYKWEVMVPADFAYKATGGHLYATRFLTGDDNAILNFLLDETYGYEFNRQACFGPDGFGTWHKVELRIVWDSTKKKNLKHKTPGEIHMSCDGIEKFSRAGRPNLAEGNDVRIALGGTVRGKLFTRPTDNFSFSHH